MQVRSRLGGARGEGYLRRFPFDSRSEGGTGTFLLPPSRHGFIKALFESGSVLYEGPVYEEGKGWCRGRARVWIIEIPRRDKREDPLVVRLQFSGEYEELPN